MPAPTTRMEIPVSSARSMVGFDWIKEEMADSVESLLSSEVLMLLVYWISTIHWDIIGFNSRR